MALVHSRVQVGRDNSYGIGMKYPDSEICRIPTGKGGNLESESEVAEPASPLMAGGTACSRCLLIGGCVQALP